MNKTHERKLLQTFGKQIAHVRKAKGLTQQELAEKVNMSVVAIAYIETGKRWARLETLYKIAKCLGVRVSDLFDGL